MANTKKSILTLEDVYASVLDESEKKFGLTAADMYGHRMSTGILCQDLIIGGGMVAGMHMISGKSQSGKSTTCMEVFKSALNSKIPIIQYRDAEGSLRGDAKYAANILHAADLEQIFGRKLDGQWAIKPKARYYMNNVIETAFDSMVRVFNRIPDKLYLNERKAWFFRITPEDKKVALFTKVLGPPDKKLSDAKYLWFQTDNPYPQAAVFMDSYPSFNPRSIDESEEGSKAMALVARVYSENIRRVVGFFNEKNIIWWGVNQIRQNPGKTMGNPEYEPCGEALQFYSNVRIQMKEEWVPEKWRNSSSNKNRFKICIESSVEGDGDDNYAYKRLNVAKNKVGPQFGEIILRIWNRDHTGKGRGVDPVFDTFTFYEMLGLASIRNGKGGRLIKFSDNNKNALAGKVVEWSQFKTLILLEDSPSEKLSSDTAKIYKKLGLDKKIKLRASAFKMLENGEANKLQLIAQSNKPKKETVDLEA